jgi:phosphate starvation-inducible membrane PsiE
VFPERGPPEGSRGGEQRVVRGARERPARPERWLNRVIERAASMLTSIIALFLIVLVAMEIVSAVGATLATVDHDAPHAAMVGLDSAFLAIILIELVHTTLSRGPISVQVQEFLVIGITSGVRSGLEAVAARGADARAVAVSLALNAAGVLILVVALWLVRQRLHVHRPARRGGP